MENLVRFGEHEVEDTPNEIFLYFDNKRYSFIREVNQQRNLWYIKYCLAKKPDSFYDLKNLERFVFDKLIGFIGLDEDGVKYVHDSNNLCIFYQCFDINNVLIVQEAFRKVLDFITNNNCIQLS